MRVGPRLLDFEEIGEITIARFLESKLLGDTVVNDVGATLFSLVDENSPKKMVLDFRRVEYLSSAALDKIITLNAKLKVTNGRLRLCNFSPEIQRLFRSYYPDIARCPFDIKPTLEESLADF
jgi:anti-sigma B factor antagonist